MKIYPIQTGTVSIKSKQKIGQGQGPMRQINMLLDPLWTEFLPIYAWVIEHPDGIIVVDTGETARTAEPSYFPKWHPYYQLAVQMKVLPEHEIGQQLRSLGLKPKDIKKVILTHLHTDHAGGLADFPESEILVSNPDYLAAKKFTGKLGGYLPQRWPSWFAPTSLRFEPNAFGPFKETSRVTAKGDVLVVPTPGHTPNHVSVIVKDEDCYLFLAGDTSYTQDALTQKLLDGVSPNTQDALQSIENILKFAETYPTVYLPSHDPESVVRLEKRQIVPMREGSATL